MLRGRYSPFNLTAFNKRLRHSLLTDVALNTDHNDVYYTKNEVNDIVEGNTFDFFLNDTLSGIGAPEYFTMDPTETGEGESTFSDTITNDAFLIDSWATSTSEPTFSALVSGIYAFHIHAETTTGANVGTVRLYWELYRRIADDPFTETLLITSEESNILTGVETEYDIHGTLSTDVVLDLTDRLVLKVYANIEVSRPTDPLVTLTAEGTTAAHFEVVTTITAFDDRYVQVVGDTMTGPLNIGGTLTVTVDDRSTITRLLDSDGDVGTPLRLMRDVEDTRLATGDGTRLQVMIRGNDVNDSTRNLFATNAFIEGTVADKRSCVDFKTARGGVLFTFLSADSDQNTTLLGNLTLPTGSLTAGVGEDAGDLIITANGEIRLNSNIILDSGDMSGIDDLTMDGTFTDGTLSIVSGTINNVAIMQGTDLDISAGTGDYQGGTVTLGGNAKTTGSVLSYKTGAITPSDTCIWELISDVSNLLPDGTECGFGLRTAFNGADATGGTSDFRIGSQVAATLSGTLAANSKALVGLFGGADSSVNPNGFSVGTVFGLNFSASHSEDFVGPTDKAEAGLDTTGCFVRGRFGAAGKVISNNVNVDNRGGEFIGHMLGQFDSVSPGGNSLNYGLIARTINDMVAQDTGTVGIDSIALLVDATASVGDLGNGGVLTSWGIVNANDVINAINGKLRIGSTVAPTNALDVTGTVDATAYEVGGQVGATGSGTNVTVVNGIVTAVS